MPGADESLLTKSSPPLHIRAIHATDLARMQRHHRGFTLVELMIALALGLIVISGVLSVFISNQQSSRANQGIGEIQDETRTAFEFMARDIRGAGLTGCGNAGRIANVLGNATSGNPADWWASMATPIFGYDGVTADPAVAKVGGTSSIRLIGAEGIAYSVLANNAVAAPPTITISDPTTAFQTGDVLIACDPDHAAIFQATNYNSATNTMQYAMGTGTPDNCSTGLGFPTVCGGTGNVYTFGRNTQISKLSAVDWYIGTNPANTTSLYRSGINCSSATITCNANNPQEMVRNVSGMQILYLESGNAAFENASTVANWNNVTAIQITLTLQSTDQSAGTTAGAISRPVTTTINLRNRVN